MEPAHAGPGDAAAEAEAHPTSEPPPGAPWDLPLDRCPFALFDLEMTGLDPGRDAIVEVAVTRILDGAVVGTLDTTVRTAVTSHPAALSLHGITPEQAAASPPFTEVAPILAALLAGAVPVAHGTALDLPFLNRAFAAVDQPQRLTHVLDTVTLARRALHARSYALGALGAKLGLGPHRWHRAGEDVRALVALFRHLLAAYAPATARDLWQVRVGQHGATSAPVVRTSIARGIEALERSRATATLVVRTPGKEPVALHGRVRRAGLHAVVTPTNGGVRLVRLDRILRIEP